jgi:hypothetical protein
MSDNPLLILVLSFIGAGCGAYFGAYLKKKGENWATHADIGKLVDQMAAVTTATKKIEAAISDDVWGRQRRWELKRDTILQTMDEISNIQGPLSALTAAGVLLQVADDESRRSAAQERINTASQDIQLAAKDLFRSMYRIQLVCGVDVQKECRNVQDRMILAHHMIAKDDSAEAARMAVDIGHATERAQAAMRHELGMDADGLKS